MSRRSIFGRTLASVAFAAFVSVPVMPAHGAVYNSVFDPVDFSGTATFDVADSCLTGSGFVSNNGDPCTVTWLDAHVTLTDGPNSASLVFGPPLPSASVVENIFVQGGELMGVNSEAIGPAFVFASGDPDLDGPWWIEYSFSLDALNVAQDGAFGLGIVLLYHGTCTPTDIGGPICVRDNDPTAVAQVLSFTRVTAVPEPGTLALLLAALAAGVSAQRRVRR